jgi:hypothetical protein
MNSLIICVVIAFSLLHFPFSIASGAPAPTPQTGQTVSYGARDDGALRPGVASPTPRFIDIGNGAVTDNLTGLTWLKNANCFGVKDWTGALTAATTLATGACGLTDDSTSGDWRLPNINELWSLVDFGRYDIALPAGHPFVDAQGYTYWSSSVRAYGYADAWLVNTRNGVVINVSNNESRNVYVWPVSSGQYWFLGSLQLYNNASDFGNVLIGSSSPATQVRLKNTGTSGITVTSTVLTGANPSDFAVNPGGSIPCSSLPQHLDPVWSAHCWCPLLLTRPAPKQPI